MPTGQSSSNVCEQTEHSGAKSGPCHVRAALPHWVSMTKRIRLLIPSMLVAAAFAAGCGDEVEQLNDSVDDAQQQVEDAQRKVDEAREAVEDPAGAAEDEARRRLEEAERDLREAQQDAQ
jgi:hypothetical protein